MKSTSGARHKRLQFNLNTTCMKIHMYQALAIVLSLVEKTESLSRKAV